MSTQLESFPFDNSLFQQHLPRYYRLILQNFRQTSRSYLLFNALFLFLFIGEVFALGFAWKLFAHSTFFAISLSGLFLTCFSYFVLLVYFQAKKPEQLLLLKDQFVSSCRKSLPIPEGEAEHHLSISAALLELTNYLEGFEWHFYRYPPRFQSKDSVISRFFAFFHWRDVFHFKQLLLNSAIEEHLRQIRLTPTDLELHASLANTFIALSKLYVEPTPCPRPSAFRKKKELFEAGFISSQKLAIEEFHILNDYAPNDPWVHQQLAEGYKELKMPVEEIREMETLLRLCPHDKDLLFRLGSLYFSQNQNAKGLRIYEDLKLANYKKAEDLISFYGKFKQLDDVAL